MPGILLSRAGTRAPPDSTTTMTPFELDILLHYYSCIDDHEVTRRNPPIWPSTMAALKECGLLAEREEPLSDQSLYYLTDRGHAYIEAVLEVPLPVQKWVLPEPHWTAQSAPPPNRTPTR